MTSNYVGIDVAKDTLAVAFKDAKGQNEVITYANDKKGINQLKKRLEASTFCTMESTGVYSQNVAISLHESGYQVAVVNPLQIKRYSQTKLNRAKTDKADALMIAEFGERMKPRLYEPPQPFLRELQQQRICVRQLKKTIKQHSQQLHCLEQLNTVNKIALKITKDIIVYCETQLKKVEQEMETLMQNHSKALYDQLQSIPGISKKSATELIIISGSFKQFDNAKQFSAYIGANPSVHESGSSIRGSKGISRIGNTATRSMLYMCSLTACRNNKECKILYDRLVLAGKPKKVALIAVINKLIKQIFGLLRTDTHYQKDYEPKIKYKNPS